MEESEQSAHSSTKHPTPSESGRSESVIKALALPMEPAAEWGARPQLEQEVRNIPHVPVVLASCIRNTDTRSSTHCCSSDRARTSASSSSGDRSESDETGTGSRKIPRKGIRLAEFRSNSPILAQQTRLLCGRTIGSPATHALSL